MTEHLTHLDVNPDSGIEVPQVAPLAETVLSTAHIELIAGRSNPQLARNVGERAGRMVDEPVTLFADGESRVKIGPNLRRKEVFIIQSTGRASGVSQNDNVQDLVFMISAAQRASADRITAVIPYYGYARQDAKDEPRVTMSASDIAQELVWAGANSLLTLDVHNEATMGSIREPWDNLYASAVLIPEIQKHDISNMTVVSPDAGGTKRAVKYSYLLGGTGDIVIVYKRRDAINKSEALAVIGEVEGKDLLLVDDIIDTAGSMTNAAFLLKDKGAKSIRVAASHGVFSRNALELIDQAPIDDLYVTDSIMQPDEVRDNPKIHIVSVAQLLTDGIGRIHSGDSLSALIPTPKK